MSDKSVIVEKAQYLNTLIQKHSVYIRYMDALQKLVHDYKSQHLLEKLVIMGKEVNERLYSEGEHMGSNIAEQQVLKTELENNPLVKEFILAQKEHLNLLHKVIERIKYPVSV